MICTYSNSNDSNNDGTTANVMQSIWKYTLFKFTKYTISSLLESLTSKVDETMMDSNSSQSVSLATHQPIKHHADFQLKCDITDKSIYCNDEIDHSLQ